MKSNIQLKYSNYAVDILQEGYIERERFIFSAFSDLPNVYDTIVIRNPEHADVETPVLGVSTRTLEEHIALINKYKLEKAIIIAESIEFIRRCPSLKYIQVIPALKENKFDFSPLYDMPEIKSLVCQTQYGDKEQFLGFVDYAKIRGIIDLGVSGKGHFNYCELNGLEDLCISDNKEHVDLIEIGNNCNLKDLTLLQCSIKTLRGIENIRQLENLSLWHDRFLYDISHLSNLSDSLKVLSIQNCSKIQDFSCLSELENLEYLELYGKNVLPDLSFLKMMKRLKMFSFDMEVQDGDLGLCMEIP